MMMIKVNGKYLERVPDVGYGIRYSPKPEKESIRMAEILCGIETKLIYFLENGYYSNEEDSFYVNALIKAYVLANKNLEPIKTLFSKLIENTCKFATEKSEKKSFAKLMENSCDFSSPFSLLQTYCDEFIKFWRCIESRMLELASILDYIPCYSSFHDNFYFDFQKETQKAYVSFLSDGKDKIVEPLCIFLIKKFSSDRQIYKNMKLEEAFSLEFGSSVQDMLAMAVINFFKTSGRTKELLEVIENSFSIDFKRIQFSHLYSDAFGCIQLLENLIKAEYARLSFYLISDAYTMVCKTIKDENIKNNIEYFLTDLHKFIKSIDKYDKFCLSYLYDSICQCTESVSMLSESLGTVLKNLLQEKVMKLQDDGDSVSYILSFRNHMKNMIKECFCDNKQIKSILDDTFYGLINLKADLITRDLVYYLDDLLTENSTNSYGYNNDLVIPVTSPLGEALDLLTLMNAKDKFDKINHRLLFKRLLGRLSISFETEALVVCYLKSIYGSDVSFKYEQMLVEIYKGFHYSHPEVPEISMRLFAKAYWPPFYKLTLNLPSELSSKQKEIESRYLLETKHKKVFWDYLYGDVEMVFKLKNKEVMIIASPVQASILVQFNDKTQLKLSQIYEKIKINSKYVLLKAVQSLISDGCSILKLRSEGNDKKLTMDSVLMINMNLNLKNVDKLLVRKHMVAIDFKCPLLYKNGEKGLYVDYDMKSTELSSPNTGNCLEKPTQIDACIVRTLKLYQQLTFDELFGFVSDFFQGRISYPLFKTRVENLVDRECIFTSKVDDDVVYKFDE